jgi:hypothetical protein
MRHDTTTAPTGARARTMAPSASAKIDAREGKLHCLYAQRVGGLEPGRGWGWCTACGRNSVFPLDGEDTCRACTTELTARRPGRQP